MLTRTRPYVSDIFAYSRRRTREVMVGDVGVGASNPIRVQSMTTTLTRDIEATVAQTERLVRAGCEIVRITTPTPADARCLGPIKERLASCGIHVPIVADIHFNPMAAMAAAEYADKVRINPGNYADSRKFAVREYSDEEYDAELARIEDRFAPLVLRCKERGIAMRIGTNHGSLSDRIMNRFGDTPEGMVESALEFVRICERHAYFNIILSMKASNPKVMIAAYRLLAAHMADEGMDYPFHLGVTEAGNGEDGRIKSAIGIGSLLEDGIGDTIRVSLTEEPEAEIPVAFALARRYTRDRNEGVSMGETVEPSWDPYHYNRRPAETTQVGSVILGGTEQIAVLATIDGPLSQRRTAMAQILRWASPAGRRQPKPEGVLVHLHGDEDLAVLQRISGRVADLPGARLALVAAGEDTALLLDALPFVDGLVACIDVHKDVSLLASAAGDGGKTLMLEACIDGQASIQSRVDEVLEAVETARLSGASAICSLAVSADDAIQAYRRLAVRAHERELLTPVVLHVHAPQEPLLPSSIAVGSPVCDGIGDAVLIDCVADPVELSFNVLQAAGTRVFKTDYVACPSCGRTLFDLQETTERIKSRTSHLVGVKIAVMGCIVNGPGEMADADFGYVGGAPGQVNLYVGKECIQKGVPAEEADDRLVDLIKAQGKWQEVEEEEEFVPANSDESPVSCSGASAELVK